MVFLTLNTQSILPLAAQARGVLGPTLGGCQPFRFPLFSPHNITLNFFTSSVRQDALSILIHSLLAVGRFYGLESVSPAVYVFLPNTNSWVRATTGDLYTGAMLWLRCSTGIIQSSVSGRNGKKKHTKTIPGIRHNLKQFTSSLSFHSPTRGTKTAVECIESESIDFVLCMRKLYSTHKKAVFRAHL